LGFDLAPPPKCPPISPHPKPPFTPPHTPCAVCAQEEERLQQELEENRGVSLYLQLAAAPADMAAAAARGIRRAADKLVLPASAGASLTHQDASKNGVSLFEVAASNGGRTHAGVLEVGPAAGAVCAAERQTVVWHIAVRLSQLGL
jgi:hypothetical protein